MFSELMLLSLTLLYYYPALLCGVCVAVGHCNVAHFIFLGLRVQSGLEKKD